MHRSLCRGLTSGFQGRLTTGTFCLPCWSSKSSRARGLNLCISSAIVSNAVALSDSQQGYLQQALVLSSSMRSLERALRKGTVSTRRHMRDARCEHTRCVLARLPYIVLYGVLEYLADRVPRLREKQLSRALALLVLVVSISFQRSLLGARGARRAARDPAKALSPLLSGAIAHQPSCRAGGPSGPRTRPCLRREIFSVTVFSNLFDRADAYQPNRKYGTKVVQLYSVAGAGSLSTRKSLYGMVEL